MPSGTFYRTYTNSGDGGTGEADPATVSNFRLDKYDVTVGRFRQFVTAWNGGAGWLPAQGSGKHTHLNAGLGLVNIGAPGVAYETGWVESNDAYVEPTNTNLATCSGDSTWTNSPGSNENLPITCETWQEAYAFCIWDGGFLPSEAEWEYAAAGGSEQREYPWGSTAPGTDNQYAIYDCYYPGGSPCGGVNGGIVAPVGSATAGAGLWGQLDLAGNLYERILDTYAPYVDPCVDCANLSGMWDWVLRGSDFLDTASLLVPPHRYSFGSSNRFYDWRFGLRCARSP